MQEEIPKEEIGLLNQAFLAFNEATSKLENSYKRLERRVESLNLELEEKNDELETSLREKENVRNYLRDILEGLPSGVVVLDARCRITTFNKTASEIAGTSAQKALGKEFGQVFDFKEIEAPSLRDLLSPKSGRQYVEVRFPNNLKEELYLAISSSTMKNPINGQLEKTLIIQDVTDVKRLEEKVARNNRLTAMGEMAAGIAHELRNPLGSIELFSSLLRRGLGDNPESSRTIDHITTGIKKMDHIISRLLVFTRSPKPNIQRYNLHKILDDILLFNDLLIRENRVEIEKRFACADPIGEGDADLLNQVFTNLILNALQSMPQGGQMTLATKEVQPAAPPTAEAEGSAPGSRQIWLSVSDTGSGIPAHVRDKIFNPFFTTKDSGTGLGLAIAHSIIKAHNGAIEFESQEGKGTTFTLSLPAWKEIGQLSK